MHIKTANGKKKIVMSRKEWDTIGKKAGWSGRLQDVGEFNHDMIVSAGDNPDTVYFTAEIPEGVKPSARILYDMNQFLLSDIEDVLEHYPTLKRALVRISQKRGHFQQIVEEQKFDIDEFVGERQAERAYEEPGRLDSIMRHDED